MAALQRFASAFGVLGGVLVLVFLGARYVQGENSPEFMAVGGLGAALLLLFLWLDREQVSEAASTRAVRYSFGALLTVLLGLAVIVALNVVAQRYDERWDLTQSGRHTLSEQSIKVAQGLVDPVDVVAFFTAGSEEEASFRDLVEGYSEHTEKLKLTLVDPVAEPMMANEYGIESMYGTVVLVLGEKRQRMETEFDEQALTNALVRLQSAKDHILCFTEGHGERALDDDGSLEGIGGLILKLEDQNYTAKKIQPLRDGRVAEDCEVVIIAGPQTEFLAQEREVLARYVASGGALVALLDPTVADGLAADFARYGVKVGDDLVLEDNPTYRLEGGDPSYIMLDGSSFDFHPIVNDLKGMSLLRVVRSVGQVEGVDGFNVQVLANTSERAWAETELSGEVAPVPDEGKDLIGRVPLIAVSEVTDPSKIVIGATSLPSGGNPLEGLPLGTVPEKTDAPADAPSDAPSDAPAEAPSDAPAEAPVEAPVVESPPDFTPKAGGRVLVFGDSDFVSNGLLLNGQNQNLFLNAVAWLVGEEDQISIRPNEDGENNLSVTTAQAAIALLVSIFVMPGIAAVIGGALWLRRRAL